MKYSIIIPVYNVKEYLERCIESILEQTYQDYEIILINDGSTDGSKEIMDKFSNKFPEIFKSYSLDKNSGQSVARNIGVSMATGDYIFFVDSDDYIDSTLLEEVNKKISTLPDLKLLRIPKKTMDCNDKLIDVDQIKMFNELDGRKAFVAIRRNRITLETPWSYIINREFWLHHKFCFTEGRVLEDFGLMPIVIMKADSVSTIKAPFYHYVQRSNSTITQTGYDKLLKKAYDTLYHYDFLMKSIQEFYPEYDLAKKEYIQYISDAVFSYLRRLNKKDAMEYKREIEKRNVIKKLKIYSMKSLIKNIWYKYYMYSLYERKGEEN